MKSSKDITKSQLRQFAQEYHKNPLWRAMTNVLAKTSAADIAYVNSRGAAIQPVFSVDIPTMKAVDQQSSGRCWIFAGLNLLRERIGKKFHIQEFEFSQSYVAFWDRLEKINYFLEAMMTLADRPVDDREVQWLLQQGIQDGGQWDMFVNIVRKYGLVPKYAMPETWQSSNTKPMNRLTNTKLRQYAAILRRMAAEGKDQDALQREKNRMLSEMYGFLCCCYGEPPERFDFEYADQNKEYKKKRDLSPDVFYQEYVGDILEEYVSIIHTPTGDKPFGHSYTVAWLGNTLDGNIVRYLNVEMRRFKEMVVKQLTDGETVWFGCDCVQDDEQAVGVWDDRLHDYKTAFGMDFSLTKEERLDLRESAVAHAMVLTGVNLADGKPDKWKVENSWGENSGHKGYYVMTDSWFDEYVYQAVVRREYLSAQEIAAYEEEPKILSPWDPMGTLA